MATVSTYTLYVKLLSGLVLPVEIPQDATNEMIRSLVYRSLPEDTRPLHPIQIELLSVEPEEKEKEKEAEEKMMCLVITPNPFVLRLDLIGSSFTLCRQCGVMHHYDRYRFDVNHRTNSSLHLMGYFYLKMGSDDLQLFPRVEGHVKVREPGDEFGEDERIVLTDCMAPVPLTDFFELFGVDLPAFSSFLQEQFLEEWETFVHIRHGGCLNGEGCHRCDPYSYPIIDEENQSQDDQDEDNDGDA